MFNGRCQIGDNYIGILIDMTQKPIKKPIKPRQFECKEIELIEMVTEVKLPESPVVTKE